MPFYQKQGNIPGKRHTRLYKADGKSLYREELVSSLGFSGIYSNKYHIHEPTRFISIKEQPPFEPLKDINWQEAVVQPYHFRTDDKKAQGNFFSARNLYLHNSDCRISIAHVSENTDHFFRNLYHHELIFIHFGQGEVLTEYGQMSFSPGDQIVMPKGTTYQLQFKDLEKVKLFIVESTTAFDVPKHYKNAYGQMEEDAPYCERDLRPPELLDPIDKTGEFHLIMKAGERIFDYTVDHHPFDVVGWDGFYYPFIFNMRDFCPKVGKVHLPPPVHLVFQTQHFVYCNFCPRLFDWHPEAIAVPYFHYNVDSDELLYYVEGDFMSRKGVGEGSMTLHPTGLAHGPQPGKIEENLGVKETHEYALMVDPFAPFHLTQNVKETMDPQYYRSWLTDVS